MRRNSPTNNVCSMYISRLPSSSSSSRGPRRPRHRPKPFHAQDFASPPLASTRLSQLCITPPLLPSVSPSLSYPLHHTPSPTLCLCSRRRFFHLSDLLFPFSAACGHTHTCVRAHTYAHVRTHTRMCAARASERLHFSVTCDQYHHVCWGQCACMRTRVCAYVYVCTRMCASVRLRMRVCVSVWI